MAATPRCAVALAVGALDRPLQLGEVHRPRVGHSCRGQSGRVGVRGFEPPASTSRTWRANQAALHPVAADEPTRRRTAPETLVIRRPPAVTVHTAARRRRSGSSGLTSQPSAPLRRARCTSATRSSSISTGTCGHGAGRLVEAQRHRDGHPAHRADLQVEDPDVERLAGASPLASAPGPRRGPRSTPTNDVSASPRAATTSSTSQSTSAASSTCTGPTDASRWVEQVAPDVLQPGQVVHVAGQQRHRRQRALAEQGGERRQLAPRPPRRARAARPGCATARRVACDPRRRRPPAPSASAAVPSPKRRVDAVGHAGDALDAVVGELADEPRRPRPPCRDAARRPPRSGWRRRAAAPSRRRPGRGSRPPCRRRPGRRRRRRPARRTRRPCRSPAAAAASPR